MPTKKKETSESRHIGTNTELYPVTKQNIDNFRVKLIMQKLEPWLFFNVSRYFSKSDRYPTTGIQITDFYGKTITMKGALYDEHCVNVFWNFIDPFLRDSIVRFLDQTLETCLERKWNPERYIKETSVLLRYNLIWDIYNKMSDINQKLRKSVHETVTKQSNYKVLLHRSNGSKIVNRSEPIQITVHPTVHRKDISDKVEKMETFLSDCVNNILHGEREAEKKPTEASGGETKPKTTQDVDGLTKAERMAYQSYEHAISKKTELAEAKDDDVYNWLKENGLPDYELPSRDTWKRYVRQGRLTHGTQKTTQRKGRTGRSIVKVNQIKYTSSQRP